MLTLHYLKIKLNQKQIIQNQYIFLNCVKQLIFYNFLDEALIIKSAQLFQQQFHIKMSKSEQQIQSNIKHQLSNTQYSHNRSRSRKFAKQVDTDLLITKAKQLYQSGQLKQALFYYQQTIHAIENGSDTFREREREKSVQMDVYYFAGAICMAINDYAKAETYLRKVVKSAGNYKNNALLFLSISLNKCQKFEEASVHLNRLCDQFKSVDGLFYRGKLRLKNMQYKQAMEDFEKIVGEIGVHTIQAKLLLLQSQLHWKGPSQNLLATSNKLLVQLSKHEQKQSQNIKKCRNIKSQILISLGKIKQASEEINKNLKSSKRDSQTLFIKSKIHSKLGQVDDQILLLNQCITVKDNKRIVVLALQTLIIYSMKQKDFYEAFQYSKRNNYLKIQNKATLCLFKIAEAITFLMKKKYRESLLLIGAIDPQVFRQLKQNYIYIKNLHYSALGYAYYSLGDHKDALSMYKKIQMNKNEPEQLAYNYNIKLCQGILAYKQGKIQESIKIFESATDYLMRAEPYFYISVILIQKNFSANADPDLITKVIQIVDSGLKVGQNYQMYYYRALLEFYLGLNAEAVDDIDKAVEKSEENVAKFFYLRGLIFFQQKNYESAASQFSTCLSIDEKFYDAYLQRAKIKLLTQQIDEAYEDLQNHPLREEWKPLFLMHQRQFNTIIDQKLGDECTQEAANFQLGNFSEAGPSGKVVLAIIGQNYEQVMNLLQDALDISFQIGCFGFDDVYLIKAYCCFKVGLTEQALEMLQKAEQTLKKNQISLSYGQEDEKKLLAIKVNAIFVYANNNQFDKSLQLCHALINDVYEGSIYDQLNKVRYHLQKLMKQQQSQTSITIFSSTPLVSDYFVQQNARGMKYKFLVPFPKVRSVELENVPFQQPLIDFTIKQIDNRAQAPWMRKDQNGVIFTNKIQIFQNLKLYTQTQDNFQQPQKNSKQRLKEQLQLDADVLQKLQKLSKNIKQSKSSSFVS